MSIADGEAKREIQAIPKATSELVATLIAECDATLWQIGTGLRVLVSRDSMMDVVTLCQLHASDRFDAATMTVTKSAKVLVRETARGRVSLKPQSAIDRIVRYLTTTPLGDHSAVWGMRPDRTIANHQLPTYDGAANRGD